ncbi:MAG: hypothetical protein QMD14_02350 [Candidatus Aenigmarchaeota archaeon]|nr:hypothetical protein [Candidatus Aenigmarchaeota archaeon]
MQDELKDWVINEIETRELKGLCGVADLRKVYNNLIKPQKEEVKKVCSDFAIDLDNGCVVSIGIALPEHAIESIDRGWKDYVEEYKRVNEILNQLASEIAAKVNGYAVGATINIGKNFDSVYYRLAILSHVTSAEQAGLGMRGKNNLLVTKEYGSAVRLASVITGKNLKRDGVFEEYLCAGCYECLKICQTLNKKNYVEDCWEIIKLRSEQLGADVCGLCLKACYENGKWRRL